MVENFFLRIWPIIYSLYDIGVPHQSVTWYLLIPCTKTQPERNWLWTSKLLLVKRGLRFGCKKIQSKMYVDCIMMNSIFLIGFQNRHLNKIEMRLRKIVRSVTSSSVTTVLMASNVSKMHSDHVMVTPVMLMTASRRRSILLYSIVNNWYNTVN